MMRIVLVAVGVVIAGVLLLAATRPATFSVQRSASIQAPPEKVYPLIADFKRWQAWSPWEKKDPAMRRTFGPVSDGKGATYAWDGNGEVGRGSMEIVETVVPSRITPGTTTVLLDFSPAIATCGTPSMLGAVVRSWVGSPWLCGGACQDGPELSKRRIVSSPSSPTNAQP